jgi:hypothetical protein
LHQAEGFEGYGVTDSVTQGITGLFSAIFGRSQTLVLLWHFVRHVLAGVVLFVIIGAAALCLKIFNDYLVAWGMPSAITSVTHYLEIAVFILDVLGFVILIFAELYSLVREIYRTVIKETDKKP